MVAQGSEEPALPAWHSLALQMPVLPAGNAVVLQGQAQPQQGAAVKAAGQEEHASGRSQLPDVALAAVQECSVLEAASHDEGAAGHGEVPARVLKAPAQACCCRGAAPVVC